MPFELSAPALQELNRKLNAQQEELSGAGSVKRLKSAMLECADIDAAAAVVRDIGDMSMSHWWKQRPIQITAEMKASVSGDEAEFVVRPAPRTRGPWRVMESGRRAWSKGEGKIKVVQTKTKGLRVRKRIVKRTLGASRGRDTWTDATKLMERRLRKTVPVTVGQAFNRIWKG